MRNTFARTLDEAFPSGTAYAAAIERSRRRDWSGILIAVVLAAVMASPYLFFAWSKS